MKPSCRLAPVAFAVLALLPRLGTTAEPSREPLVLETAAFRLQLSPDTGRCDILDRRAGVIWGADPAGTPSRFGEVTLRVDGNSRRVPLGPGAAVRENDRLLLTFRPLADRPDLALRVSLQSIDNGTGLECLYQADPGLAVENVRLLDDLLWVTDAEKGYAVIPVREGLLVPSDSGLAFTQRFETYAYEGCHLAMFGLVKAGAAVLVSWTDPYPAVDLRSSLTKASPGRPRQTLSASLQLRQSATSFRLRFLGRGDYQTLARAYRDVARESGWRVTWDQKLKQNPDRARLFGASNFKLWSALDRRMNDESTREESVRINWTFDEAADVAEHLKNDLKLDRILFLMGGWIHRGYDNQHPDILPAAPECGGDPALAEASRRIRRLGYVFGLHDNYQDIYRDAPSWNENFIMKTPDGSLARGGQWAGGRAYLTCSRQALELARRPQNLPAVRQLTGADAYFIDTTYAAGLQECHDPKHPLTRSDDLKWKQAISDYSRDLFGIFGSECGREWAIPHSDFFEGLTGVSGRHYHDAGLEKKTGGTGVPLFEMIYRDTIALYGKYGYAPEQAAEYVLHHLLIGRPLHYHAVPPHRYWNDPKQETETLAVRPAVGEVTPLGPRQFRISYRWTVAKTPSADWRLFVHFTEAGDRIRFQNDHDPAVPTSRWLPGSVSVGPFTVTLPAGANGSFPVRIGLYQPDGLRRALFEGADPEERSRTVGTLIATNDTVRFEPAPEEAESRPSGGDPAVFTRADQGWAEGRHPFDRFLKNTHEILSPVHELTAQALMTRHDFLTPDRKVQRSVFGEGPDAMEVVVNAGDQDFQVRSRHGGDVALPAFGFLVEGRTFAAFHARNWNGLTYEAPVLFTLRALDDQPLTVSQRVRIFHAFGDPRLRLHEAVRTIERERVIEDED